MSTTLGYTLTATMITGVGYCSSLPVALLNHSAAVPSVGACLVLALACGAAGGLTLHAVSVRGVDRRRRHCGAAPIPA